MMMMMLTVVVVLFSDAFAMQLREVTNNSVMSARLSAYPY
jgi:hypothetical protein